MATYIYLLVVVHGAEDAPPPADVLMEMFTGNKLTTNPTFSPQYVVG